MVTYETFSILHITSGRFSMYEVEGHNSGLDTVREAKTFNFASKLNSSMVQRRHEPRKNADRFESRRRT